MRNIFLVIVLFFSILNLQAQETAKFQDTIPFRSDFGVIIIPISFNGIEKEFMFDTGAQISLGYSWVKDELKRTSKSLVVTSSNNSKTKLSYYKSGTITLGSKEIKKHRILAQDDSAFFSCYGVDGVLGVDVIKLFNWTIDFKKMILIMSPADFYPGEVKDMYALDFDFKNRTPGVYMTLNNKKIQFLLDTGASRSDLNDKQYALKKLEQYPKVKMYGGFYDFNGVLTKTVSSITKLSQLTSGGVTINPVVSYGKKSTKLGNDSWQNNRLFMSLQNDELFVEREVVNHERLNFDCIAVIQDGKMIVVGLEENSEAWKLGIRQGDVIKSINGKMFTDFCSLSKYQRKLGNENKSMMILMENGNKFISERNNPFIKL